MSLKATSIRLDEDTLNDLEMMAEAMERPRAWLMAQAVKQYVAREKDFICEVEKGIQAADDRRLVDHASVRAKWESKRVSQMD